MQRSRTVTTVPLVSYVQNVETVEDEDAIFCRCLIKKFKRVPLEKKSYAQMQLLKVFMDLEEGRNCGYCSTSSQLNYLCHQNHMYPVQLLV